MNPLRATLRAALLALLLLLPGAVVAALASPAGAVAALPRASETRLDDTYVVHGRVVRTVGRRVVGVRGVKVTAYEVSPLDPRGNDLTDADGRFVIRGVQLQDSEVGVYVNGSRVGFDRGWVGCDKTLKPTWGGACSQGTAVGWIRITPA